MRRWFSPGPSQAAHDAEVVQTISRVGQLVSSELDLPKLVQVVTDAATQLTAAAFGAFFYNVTDPAGERYTLYALSGAPRSAFEKFPMPRNTAVFGPTFRGEGVVRLDDVMKDARYGKSAPYFGMPKGHLPVVSYLAVPVVARDGEVLGGLFFGHPQPGMFTERHEHIVTALAAHAAIAMQNARRYEEARRAQAAAEAAERRASFLADAGIALGAALDVEAVLQRVTELAVPRMGDWCAVFMRGDAEAIRCHTFEHRDPAKTPPGRAYIAAQPIAIDAPFGVGKVIRTGETELAGDISDEQLRAVARDEEGVRIRKEIGHGSVLIVPLRVGACVQGAIAFGRAARGAYADIDRVVADDLGRRIALALQNAQLYRDAQEARANAERARAEAETANRAKDDFLAVLSHELRTPLNSIGGWVQILAHGALPAAQVDRAIQTVGRNVVMLRRLIEDLLDVSSIIAGKLAIETAPCDLAPIVEQTVEAVGRDAAAKDVRVKAELEPAVVVDADPVRLRQVVGNLLSNAIKFAPEGGDVTVTLRRENGRVSLVVSDTGPGVPADVLPHVFDRFRQADSSSTRRHGGLGLGLAIVKHLVELHGGTVRAENGALNRGAIFTIELPTVA